MTQRDGSSKQKPASAVSALDIGCNGTSYLRIGDFVAQVTVKDGKGMVEWLDQSGAAVDLTDPEPRKTRPAKIITGELRRFAGLKSEQIERLYTRRRPLTYADWRERYLDNAANAPIVRRLIWSFGGVAISEDPADQGIAAIYRDARFIAIDGKSMPAPSPETTVKLWHPIYASVRDVLSWRTFLEALGITQPFKQTYREIYVLTDAERQTHIYSNRFASHILQMRQFQALSRTRQWLHHPCGWRGAPAEGVGRQLPDWKMRADFHVQLTSERNGENETFYFVTDQVRFYDKRNNAAPLDTIPPVVFSEIMRDIDLFVGVSSIGNDPGWRDTGSNALLHIDSYR